MPMQDKTGPQGEGPLTGRQMGNCPGAKPKRTGFFGRLGRGAGRGAGKGDGRGAGRGFGLGRRA